MGTPPTPPNPIDGTRPTLYPPDPKHAFPALKALGEIDGVDAFKRRSEVTVKLKPIDEVEKDLLARLEKLERLTGNGKSDEVIDVEAIDADSREDSEA
jgi:hypothetical protein